MSEYHDVTDSDNIESRCGHPARSLNGKWRAPVLRLDGVLVIECPDCGAAWEWGYPCATEVRP